MLLLICDTLYCLKMVAERATENLDFNFILTQLEALRFFHCQLRESLKLYSKAIAYKNCLELLLQELRMQESLNII